MLFEDITPFIRFADEFEYLYSRDYTMTYDCRLIYILNGRGSITVRDMNLNVSPGLLITFQPGTPYKICPSPCFRAIAVDFDYTKQYINETKIYPPVSTDMFDKTKMHEPIEFENCGIFNSPLILSKIFSVMNHLNELTEEFKAKKMFYNEKSSLIFKNIIFELVRYAYSINNSVEIAELVLEYIAKNYKNSITNNTIAQTFHYSPGYLNRVVLSYTGMSMHKYLMQYRINIATKLLIASNMTIADIAVNTGFYSTSHFSNTFKSITGNSPSVYKNYK